MEVDGKKTKIDRKVHRAVNKIGKEIGSDVFSKTPTSTLMLCNSGHVTGATHEDVLELFSKYGPVEKVTLVAGKSFSFVTFGDISSATNALVACNGQQSLLQQPQKSPPIPVYITYVNAIPDRFLHHRNVNNASSAILPEGLTVHPDFISDREELELLNHLQKWHRNSELALKNRQVRHFGKAFVYGSNTIEQSNTGDDNVEAFPPDWTPIIERCLAKQYLKRWPDQCTANRYLPGQGIPPHVDNHECCDDTILSLSLGSDVVMNFASLDHDGHVIPVNLPRRSLLVMTGRSRYAFTHGIAARKSDIIEEKCLKLRPRGERISLTFRSSLRTPKCECDFPAHCPSRGKTQIDEKIAPELEKLHVHQVYEEIADHFSETRHKPWPQVMQFLSQTLSPASVLVDVGCGNGKYLGHFPNIFELGLDYSKNLLDIVTTQKGQQALRSDMLYIPLRDGVADVVINIAVIHHLSTKARRIKALQELWRILRKGGSGLIYAWAKDQEMDCQPSTYMQKTTEETSEAEVMTRNHVRLPVHENRTNFKHADLLVPWTRKNTNCTFHRFYHVFQQGELENLLNEATQGQVAIQKSYYDQGNWCVIFVKQ